MKTCLDPKFLAAVPAVAASVYLLTPDAFVAALPFLLLALCPLMMAMMMRMIRSGGHSSTAAKERTPPAGSGPEQSPIVSGLGEPAAQEDEQGTDLSSVTEADRLRARLADVEARLASLDSAPVPTEGGEAAAPPRRPPRSAAQPASDGDAASLDW